MGEFRGASFEFEWDDDKLAENIRKHGVDFEEAASVFDDELMLTEADVYHSADEDRFVSIGLSNHSRLPVVVYTDRVRMLRIISVRLPTPKERRAYENSL